MPKPYSSAMIAGTAVTGGVITAAYGYFGSDKQLSVDELLSLAVFGAIYGGATVVLLDMCKLSGILILNETLSIK